MHAITPRFVLLFALVTVPATAQKAPAVVEPSAKAPRGEVLEWRSAQGRTYWYRLPKEMGGKESTNLVLMLHGTGLDHRWSFANYFDLPNQRRRDLMLSPDGLTPGQGDTFNFVQGPKDGEQIAGLIADFKARFPIDRVYLYGHSQGAFFTYWFAGEHPELIDGIIAHAGNVLDVKHDKLAKQKVAIAILHGRADGVVPVDCAIRTEKIYRDEGYAKLKLEIVDGLTEQSGHWPLPDSVVKLLEWLDQVSTQSAAQSLAVVANEVRAEAPDLTVITEHAKKVRALLPKASEAEKKEFAPVLAALQAFVAKAALIHSEHLLASGEVADPKAAFGAWAVQFQRADAAFGDDPEWKKRMVKARDLAKAHEQAVDKAKKALEKTSKSKDGKGSKEARAAALKTFEDAFLAASATGLRSVLELACTNSQPPDDECKRRLLALVEARNAAAVEAKKAAAAIDRPLLEELKTAAPSLFESSESKDEGK